MISGGKLTLIEGDHRILADTTSGTIWLAPVDGGAVCGVPFLSGPDDQVGLAFDLAGHAPNTDYRLFFYDGALCSAPMPAAPAPAAPPAPLGYVQATGTPIGGMVAYGGIAAAFNGGIEGWAASAHSPGIVAGIHIDGTVGLSGLISPVTRFVAKSPSDNGFLGNNASGSWQLRGSNSTFAASTVITSGSFVAGNAVVLDLAFSNTAVYSSVWFVVVGNTTNGTYLSELALFSDATISAPAPPPQTGSLLTRKNGVPVNASELAAKANSGPITIPAGEAYDLGAFRTDASGNTVTAHRSYGPDRKFNLWNRYHQQEIRLRAGILFPASPIPTKPTGYNPGVYMPAWAPIDNNPANCLTVFQGEDGPVKAQLSQTAWMLSTSSQSVQYQLAVGLTPTQPSGRWAVFDIEAVSGAGGWTEEADYAFFTSAGAQKVYGLANRGGGGTLAAWTGERDLCLEASWWG